ncbi:MAG: HAD hydrolase family protein [Campylobacterales bacterium]|nr:HAD hydrolase family protein [Campylobacterales bacterium]
MIELIVFDVDGTLTDGKIIYSNSGEELKQFDVKDGLAIATWTKKFGKKAAIITGRRSTLVEKRAKELGITHLYQGVENKDEILKSILDRENLAWDNVAAIGDDLNDLSMMHKVGLSFCVGDGSHYLKSSCNIVCDAKGGAGAAREAIEYVLQHHYNTSLAQIWE